MPMAIKQLGAQAGFKGVSVERGLGGAAPGAEAAYIAICHFLFDSVEDFMAAFSPHVAKLQGACSITRISTPLFNLMTCLYFSS